MLSEVACQHCEAAGLEVQADGAVKCRYCGTVNHLEGVVCPACEHVNAPGADVCANCRRTLVVTCPACGVRNWSGAEACADCGRTLDSISRLSTRYGSDPANFYRELQQSAAPIKARETAASGRRMAEMEAMEQRRLAALAEARRRQQKQQRALTLVLLLVVVGFALIVAAALAVTYFSK